MISGYRHKVAFFKTPGDLWMLKRTSPNVCLAIAPNYRLQNEIPTIECGGNVITRRFVGPLLRRYCDPTTTPSAGKSTTRRLICEGRAIGGTPDDLSDDVRKADDTRRASYTRADDTRRADDIQRHCTSGCREVRCGSEGWLDARTGLPWHVGRVYSENLLTSDSDRSRSNPAREGTRSSLTVSLMGTKDVIVSKGIAIPQQPQFHLQHDFPVLYEKIKRRAFTSLEKKSFGQVGHESEIMNCLTLAETGSNSTLRTHPRLNHRGSLVVCKRHPLTTRSGPTVAKSPNLIIRRCVNNTPENEICNFEDDQESQTLGEAEERSEIRAASDQSITLPLKEQNSK